MWILNFENWCSASLVFENLVCPELQNGPQLNYKSKPHLINTHTHTFQIICQISLLLASHSILKHIRQTGVSMINSDDYLNFSLYTVTSRSSKFSWVWVESLQLAKVFVNKWYLFSINMSPSWPTRVDCMGQLRWLICLFFFLTHCKGTKRA